MIDPFYIDQFCLPAALPAALFSILVYGESRAAKGMLSDGRAVTEQYRAASSESRINTRGRSERQQSGNRAVRVLFSLAEKGNCSATALLDIPYRGNKLPHLCERLDLPLASVWTSTLPAPSRRYHRLLTPPAKADGPNRDCGKTVVIPFTLTLEPSYTRHWSLCLSDVHILPAAPNEPDPAFPRRNRNVLSLENSNGRPGGGRGWPSKSFGPQHIRGYLVGQEKVGRGKISIATRGVFSTPYGS